jgi:hypothetical protein
MFGNLKVSLHISNSPRLDTQINPVQRLSHDLRSNLILYAHLFLLLNVLSFLQVP